MATRALQAAGWVLVGMIIMGLIVWITMPSLMLIEHKSPLDYEQTVAALNDVIANKQNWKVSNVFDYQKNIQDAAHGPIDRVGRRRREGKPGTSGIPPSVVAGGHGRFDRHWAVQCRYGGVVAAH